MSTNVVEVRDLSRQFGATRALDGVSLKIEPGLVYGLVGANGHGKTTLIKHLLGTLRAQHGSVRVFGLDPVRHPVEVLRRVGYLSEERELPEWMRIDELMRYTRAWYPNWDEAFAGDLLRTFDLDTAKRIKELSKGMRAQVGLVAAVAHRPELLLLDEPSTGLDAVVRKDILNAIVRTVANEGRTVLFSSHLLDEVEQMSDYLFMIVRGRVVLQEPLDDIKEQHRLLTVRYSGSRQELAAVDGILSAERLGDSWSLVSDRGNRVHESLQAIDGEVIHSRSASLQEIFIARAGRDAIAATRD